MIDTSKTIIGTAGGRYTVTAPIVKEDYGLYLKIEGLELPETYQVDFSNSEHNGTSVTMIGNADGVLIPRQFIDSGKDVFAFLYHVGEDFGRTIYKIRIPNKVRPDRTNEQPTPEEQSVIDQTIAELIRAVESAQGAHINGLLYGGRHDQIRQILDSILRINRGSDNACLPISTIKQSFHENLIELD